VARRFDLEDRLIRFGAEVCRLAEQLPATPAGRHIAQQVIRSGTSPLANYAEVQAAESRRDFIHKLGLCLKEQRETMAWLKLIKRLELSAPALVDTLLGEGDQLAAVLSTSIRTARQRLKSVP
jgi:four helix bundle protein